MKEIPQIINQLKSAKAPGIMTTKIIAIDGQGGAGKSTFANQLSKALGGAPIIRTDDFASWDNPLKWWPRVIEQVLRPISENQTAHYQRYDWDKKQMAEWHDVEPAPHIILEGVSASREAFRPYLAFSIWVNTPREERLRRGLERDGEGAKDKWAKWMADEDDYVKREQPEQKADIVISGTEQKL